MSHNPHQEKTPPRATNEPPRSDLRPPSTFGSLLVGVLAAGTLALLLLTATETRPPVTVASLVDALERDRSSQAARDRLAFVGAMELRLDRLDRLQTRLETRGVGTDARHTALEILHEELVDDVLELKTEQDLRWRNAREEVLARADRLQDSVLDLVDSA